MLLLLTISLYFYLLLLMGGLMSTLLSVLMLELLSWVFVLFLSKGLSLKYLMVQVGFLFLGLFGAVFSKSALTSALLLKTGMPPFQFWFLSFCVFLPKWVFFFFTTAHKLLPLFFFTKILSMNMLLLIWTTIFISGVMMLQAISFYFLLMFSSMVHFGWLLMASLLKINMAIFYWVLYTFLMGLFLKSFSIYLMKFAEVNQSVILSAIWLVISGLPPFTMFLMKMCVLVPLSDYFLIMLVVMLISIVSLISYYRAYHLSLSLLKTMSTSSAWLVSFMMMVNISSS